MTDNLNGAFTGDRMATLDVETACALRAMLDLAPRGLATAYLPETGEFAQTVRGVTGPEGVRVRREGTNVRYTAMAALGLSRLDEEVQRGVLAGKTAAEVARQAAEQALDGTDPGAVALAAWAEAEVNATYADKLFGRMSELLSAGVALHTVDTAWMVTAAVAAAPMADTDAVLDAAAALLVGHQGAQGIYPHRLPASAEPRWRAHVGSFADQVYPLQALARAGAHRGGAQGTDWLARADRTAERLVELQGDRGQWWWHYDCRDGSVVEAYPVYSVHQHAMAPMVLHDLREAGGADHTAAVTQGVRWLQDHPEVVEELVSARWGLVWRKVGRREPRKAARALQAAVSMLRRGARLPGVDRFMPAVVVDHECRPYELGWMLYAWLPALSALSREADA